MHALGWLRKALSFSWRRNWKCVFLVFCPAVMRNKLPTVSIPSKRTRVRKMRWTTAPCLVPTSGYPGERKAVEPFCRSQYPRHAAVSVTAGSSAGAIPNHRNMCGRYRATSHGLPRISLAERCWEKIEVVRSEAKVCTLVNIKGQNKTVVGKASLHHRVSR